MAWQTNEQEPRAVTIIGKWLADPDCSVIEIEGKRGLIIDCGSSFDGKVVGTKDTYLRPASAMSPGTVETQSGSGPKDGQRDGFSRDAQTLDPQS